MTSLINIEAAVPENTYEPRHEKTNVLVFYLVKHKEAVQLRGAFGKYVARSFFSVTDKQTHLCMVSF